MSGGAMVGETEFYDAYDRMLAKWPMAVHGEAVPSRYGTTWVNSCGPDGGSPIVLLPGAGATSTAWLGAAAELGAAYRVHAVDLLGDAGRSVADGDPIQTVGDLAEWLDGILAHFGYRQAAVAGHSYGAMISLAYAMRRPGRVRALALVDPNNCFAGMAAGYLLRALPVLARPTGERFRRLVAWETHGHVVDSEWLELAAHGTAVFRAAKTVVPKRPTPERLAALRVPAAVIVAADSRVHDAHAVAAAAAASMPTAQVRVLPGAAHHTLPMAPELGGVLAQALAAAIGQGSSCSPR
jgi:pimeloyl-ACP methyl ester carboxylesterase